MPAESITDEEFGIVKLRRVSNARSVKISMSQHGVLQATLPRFASVRHVRKLIDSSRPSLRKIIASSDIKIYSDGMRVGKNHYIIIKPGTSLKSTRKSPTITIYKPPALNPKDQAVQAEIKKHVTNALRSEAKKYLPERLKILAKQHGYQYSQVRFSHAKTRWGSCSSNGTISLNIALMNLPFELIDYVLIHELCHTREMNHSRDFWNLVAKADQHYALHRRALKKHSPTI